MMFFFVPLLTCVEWHLILCLFFFGKESELSRGKENKEKEKKKKRQFGEIQGLVLAAGLLLVLLKGSGDSLLDSLLVLRNVSLELSHLSVLGDPDLSACL